MTDGMFCVKYLSQYQEILSKARLFGTGKYRNWVEHCSVNTVILRVKHVKWQMRD